ncbi:outer membrane lipoprotein-sorting protein [Chitinimonas koreensis]|uniref:outer membrane lipoprotein-sorting protein n=1 Tax=Chitinimonas koreensis TaxID=356302 RepID=UPI0003F59899|nr:outer membrane lipoprotein-sorting protein [Chitinimonas koreensis]QNM98210.1 outer membrane lipoprotein-sorting protein [Chitinimonas koreensis]
MNKRIGMLPALLLALPGWAADATALMKESDRRIKAPDETVQYDMELYDGDKLVHSRKLLRLDKQMDGKNSTLIRFQAPAAVKNVGLLIEDTGAAINDIWSYTPATKSLRRIAGAQKQNWFMGTEFTYEDFEDYKLKSYRFEQVDTLAPCLRWAKCAVIEATPNPGAEAQASGYGKKRYYIEQASQYPVQIEYFDRQGALAKRLTTESLKSYGSYSRPQAQTMWNAANNRKTRMVVTELTIKPGLVDSQFTQRALRNEE